ncbi:MAG: hypothetical protein M5R36_17430 [Deltaproteobacteria bacterium]|nr:hypothetical protein [Deltaproteobacteria bacterium]
MIGGDYAAFADENKILLLAPTFNYDENDWYVQASYQYPEAWSGQAALDMVDEVAVRTDVDKGHLFLFGFSAGAQFAHRFALLYPKRSVAVASHAAGGYTLPEEFIKTDFLITVGSLDVDRLSIAEAFLRRRDRTRDRCPL